MNQETYRRIVSGQDQSYAAKIWMFLFAAVSLVYGFVVRMRNLFFDWSILRSHSATVPVISVGNITAGGTGKTPLVIWLCNYLNNKGIRNGILTRGYKTQPGQISDEPALLAKQCPNSTVIVNSNRVAGAQKAQNAHHAQALVMDDGFQHRRLLRDLDIVVVDASCPFGYGRVLPAGLLREYIQGLSRASAIVITRADQVGVEELNRLHQKIIEYAGDIPTATTVHRHTYAICHPNQRISLDKLQEEKIFAFCGIGNPTAFFDSLEKSHLAVCGTKTFDDHHIYTPEDIEQIYQEAETFGATMILCTQKDWSKSALLGSREGIVFACLAMELDFLEGADKIKTLIDNLFEDIEEADNEL